jgi:hypothetical protein
VIRAAQRALNNSLGRPFTHLTSLDFSNAFNTVDRRGCVALLPASTEPENGLMGRRPISF